MTALGFTSHHYANAQIHHAGYLRKTQGEKKKITRSETQRPHTKERCFSCKSVTSSPQKSKGFPEAH